MQKRRDLDQVEEARVVELMDRDVEVQVVVVAVLGRVLESLGSVLFAPGKLPDEFMVVEGEFKIADDGGNKVLELQADPIADGAVLFGQSLKGAGTISARIAGRPLDAELERVDRAGRRPCRRADQPALVVSREPR